MEGAVVNQVQDHFFKMYDFILDQKIQRSCIKNKEQNSKCVMKHTATSFSLEDEKYFRQQPVFENGSDARILTHEALFNQRKFA